MSTIKWFLTRY